MEDGGPLTVAHSCRGPRKDPSAYTRSAVMSCNYQHPYYPGVKNWAVHNAVLSMLNKELLKTLYLENAVMRQV
jgi:hypothetical protein